MVLKVTLGRVWAVTIIFGDVNSNLWIKDCQHQLPRQRGLANMGHGCNSFGMGVDGGN